MATRRPTGISAPNGDIWEFQDAKVGDITQTGVTGATVAAQISQLNDEIAMKINKTSIQSGKTMFPSAAVGNQSVTVTFPKAFTHVPQVMVSWDDNSGLQSYFKYPLKITSITTTGFTVQAERLIAAENWWFRYIAVDSQ